MHRVLLLLLIALVACQHEKESTLVKGTCTIGKVDRYSPFESTHLPGRTVDVWLPNDYNPEERYAVLYMHDGQMLFDPETTWNKQCWEADRTLQRLMDSGSIRQTIIVALWNSSGTRHSDYFPERPWGMLDPEVRDSIYTSRRQDSSRIFNIPVRSDDYLIFIVEDVKPYIDNHYSTLPDRDNTLIMGSSMGGLISIYALCEYQDVFGGAGCLSTHWTGIYTAEKNPIPATFAEYLDENLPAPGKHRIYFDHGDQTLDSLYAPFQLAVDSVMAKKGYDLSNWMTRRYPGTNHSEKAWAERLEIPVNFLLKK